MDLFPRLFGSGLCLRSALWRRRSSFVRPGFLDHRRWPVGQVVFRALNLIESVFLLIVLVGLLDDSLRVRAMVLFLAGLFAFQQLVLRPPLDRQIAKSILEEIRVSQIYIVPMCSSR